MDNRPSSSPKPEGKRRAVEVLEVEDEDQRQARMHDVLARLDASSARPTASPGLPLPNLDGQPRLPLEPNSELLSRVQAFLPQLAESNAELADRVQNDPSSVDIENVTGDEAYIEMNLGLGVFEQRRGSDAAASQSDTDTDSDTNSDSSTESAYSTSSSESDGTDSDSSTEDAPPIDRSSSSRPIRPLPKRRPRITVIGDESNHSTS
ncbi:hypothetical protein DAEQUDRAFT_724525 [Daedalea quercina L-15889]|uniref:Uncharacterized protein n=1 Tax=Daedalea quercina L-15889 TaxID=1314783 RepID=A0A165RTY7_9APHY|nr:hypothetical protein DAEQUDRAFT_724525 [Daedalea quercina L-15889]